MSLDDYKDYYQHDPYDYNEHADADINRTPVGDEKPQPYRVRKTKLVNNEYREDGLTRVLEELLNEQAKENYHPIKFEPVYNYGTRINNEGGLPYRYIVTFYYAPNGPAFTPPF